MGRSLKKSILLHAIAWSRYTPMQSIDTNIRVMFCCTADFGADSYTVKNAV